jgi:ParB-like chromosome segregation protein Spo0J
MMLKPIPIKIDDIYVPSKWRKTLDSDKVELLAESILEEGHKAPIQLRKGEDRYVLVSGYHRLEALKALGEEKISAIIVGSKKF